MDLDKVLEVGIAAAKGAGNYLLENQSKVNVVTQKSSTDWLLEQDQHADNLITSRIRESFPDHSILAEESGLNEKKSQYQWIIDPLDGSFNYQHGWPLFGVIIGFANQDSMKVSVIFLPVFDELYTAVDGEGAYLNGKAIHVSSVDDLKKAEVLFGDFDKKENQEILRHNLEDMTALANNVGRVRMVGSAAVDHAFIARGVADGLVGRGGGKWDIEVGKKLIEEAGGIATFTPNDYGGRSIFGNKIIYEKLSEIIK